MSTTERQDFEDIAWHSRGHIVLISNGPAQICDNSALGGGLMAVAYVKSTSSACANSCAVSRVRRVLNCSQTAEVWWTPALLLASQTESKDKHRRQLKPLMCQERSQNSPYFLFQPPTAVPLPRTSFQWSVMAKLGIDPIPSFSPALLRHILSLFSFEMTRSALCPAATCHQRGSQPRPTTRPTPADVPEWTLGREGPRGSGGRTGSERKSP